MSLGGQFASSTSNEQAMVVTSEFLKKDFMAGLDLTSGRDLLHPTFSRRRSKKDSGSERGFSARRRKIILGPRSSQYFRAFYGPAHPYGHVAG